MKLKYIKSFGVILLGFSLFQLSPIQVFAKKPILHRVSHKTKQIKKIQLALLLDTSNSMDGLINQAKNQLWETVSHLSKELPEAEIEIALYHYGNNGLSIYNDYVQRLLSFTNNLDKVSSELFKLKTSGGSEFCGSVLDKATKELVWDNKTTTKRILVIAGNEAFNQGTISYATSIASAVKKDIQVNTIFCGNNSEGINTKWKEGATLGNGSYFSINHNDKVQQIATPYDDKIIDCNTKINSTYIPIYQNQMVQKEEMEYNDQEQVTEQKERLVEKALVKKNKAVYNKDKWDAVDNYTSNNGSIKDLKSAGTGYLNSKFKDKTDNEIKIEIEKLKSEREVLHQELTDLEELRTKFLIQNKPKSSDKKTLGKQLVQSILK